MYQTVGLAVQRCRTTLELLTLIGYDSCMKSAVLQEYRSPLVILQEESKALQKYEVRIDTAYAGISFTDRIIQLGLYKYQRKHMPLPYVPGFEASGTVSEVGEEVTDVQVGDKVVVLQRLGCLSSEIVANVEHIIQIPDDVDLARAASLPVNFFTASHAYNNIVKIFPDSNVLVTSAAGGVGGILTQIASPEHAVTGLVSKSQKKDYVMGLGASRVFTYDEFEHSKETFDVIFTASGDNLDQYSKRLNKNGKLILYGFHSMVPKSLSKIIYALYHYLSLQTFKPFDLVYNNKTVSGFNIIHLDPASLEFRAIRKDFIERIQSGTMPSNHEISEYSLDQVNEGLADISQGNTKGKLVVKL